MPAINLTDLSNAKLDVDHIAAIATSANPTATDRLGATKKTIAGIVASGQMALSVEVYATASDGLVATASGKYFSVPSVDSAESLIMYLNSAGVAVEQKRYPSTVAVAALDGSYSTRTGISDKRLALTDGEGFEIFKLGLDGSMATDTVSLLPEQFKTPVLEFSATKLVNTAFSMQAASDLGVSTGLAMQDAEGFYVELVRSDGTLNTPTNDSVATVAPVSALKALREALNNELCDVMLRLVGDSITWGMTVTSGGIITPRNATLSDTRNNLTSPTWANMLHQYLGKAKSFGSFTSPSAGVALYTAVHQIDVCNDPKTPVLSSLGAVLVRSTAANASAMFGAYLDVPVDAALNFQITGDNFTVVYGKSPGNAASAFEVFVDDVSQGTVSTYAASESFGSTAVYAVAQGQHTIRLKAVVAVARLECLRFTRKIRVANDGIIGQDTYGWMPTGSLLPNSVANDDTFVICMLGTNDRSSGVNVPVDPARTKRNLAVIADYISVTRGKKLILMAANFATPDYPGDGTKKYGQADVARMTAQVCAEKGHSFIDHYQSTLQLSIAGNAFLADGLHPGDAGHLDMFKNIVAHIETAI